MDAWDELPEEKKGKGPPKVAKVICSDHIMIYTNRSIYFHFEFD